jgi:hypothetical protein
MTYSRFCSLLVARAHTRFGLSTSCYLRPLLPSAHEHLGITLFACPSLATRTARCIRMIPLSPRAATQKERDDFIVVLSPTPSSPRSSLFYVLCPQNSPPPQPLTRLPPPPRHLPSLTTFITPTRLREISLLSCILALPRCPPRKDGNVRI